MSKNYTITAITQSLSVGTRIYWDDKKECLYFVDVPESHLYKYDTKTKKTTKVKVGTEPLAFAFPVAKAENKFVGGLARKFVTFEWNGSEDAIRSLTVVAEVDTEGDLVKNRLNGAKVDPNGVLWAGTMGPDVANGTEPGKGSLYSLSKGVVKKHESNIGISNGLVWNLKKNKMYYVDTLSPEIYVYDYDAVNVKLSNKKVVFNVKDNNLQGKPDGLAIDNDGNIWIAMIFGSDIVKINPDTGKVLQKIKMPTIEPTALTFGDKSLNNLYVTTAKIPENGKVPEPPAGCTFVIENLGATGPKDTEYVA